MLLGSLTALLLVTPSKRTGGAEDAPPVPPQEAAAAEAREGLSTEAGAIPPAGGMAVAVSSTTSTADLLRSIPFEVTFLGLFDLMSQAWMTAIPGAPEAVNGSFDAQLRAGALVWVRRSHQDARESLVWPRAAALDSLVQAQPLLPPAPGAITVGASGTSSVATLIDAQAFTVALVTTFDVRAQEYLTYIPGAPTHVNTLAPDHLSRDTIVWMKRVDADPRITNIPAVPTLAAVVPSGIPLDGSVSTTGIPAAAPAPGIFPSAAQPVATPLTPPNAPAPATVTAAPRASASPAGALAAVFRSVSYESGLSTTEQSQTSADGLGTTQEAARRGVSAGYALLRPDDPRWSGGGFRAEWHGEDHTSGPGAERWHGISYYFPSNYNQGRNAATWDDRIIFQFADEGSPMFSLHLDAARQELWVRRKMPEKNTDGSPRFQELARWKFSTQRWYDLAFHIRWTKDGTGVFELYVDREKKVDYRGRTLGERDATYSKWGIYGQPTRLLFDEVRIASGANGLDAISP